MVRFEVLQHEQEEVTDDFSNDDSMPVHLKLELLHFGKAQLVILLATIFFPFSLVFVITFFITSLGLIIEEAVCLLERFGLEFVLLEELFVMDEEVETGAPLSMQIEVTFTGLVVGTCGEENSKQCTGDKFWRRWVIVHITLVE